MMRDEAIQCRWATLLSKCYTKEITEAQMNYPETKSIVLDWKVLDTQDKELSELVLSNPTKAFKLATIAIDTIETPVEEKHPLQIEVRNLLEEVAIDDINNSHIGKFIQVSGVVTKMTEVRGQVENSKWLCKQCGAVISMIQGDDLITPLICPEEQEGCGRRSTFELLLEQSTVVDYQEAYLLNDLHETTNKDPVSLRCILTKQLTNQVNRATRFKLTGTISGKKIKETSQVKFVLKANSIWMSDGEIVISEEDKTKIIELSKSPDIIELLSESVAPHIYDMSLEKRTIALQLFNTDIGVLMIGDPSAGKSELMKAVCRRTPNSSVVVASKKQTTGGGLVGIAEKDPITGEWMYCAGALVRNNGGLTGIDEISAFEGEQDALLQMMNDKVIDVNKASLHLTLPANTGIIATANPKHGRLSDTEDMKDQLGVIIPPLFSRFDAVFIIKDAPDKERDRNVSMAMMFGGTTAGAIDWETMLKYRKLAMTLDPQMTNEAGMLLVEYFTKARGQGNRELLTIDNRANNALRRYAKAIARIRLRGLTDPKECLILPEDAEIAVKIFSENDDKYRGTKDVWNCQTGKSKSKGEKILTIKGTLREGKELTHEEWKANCLAKGITEEEFDILSNKLINETRPAEVFCTPNKKWRVV